MVILNGNFEQYKLPNGLVVALQKTPSQNISSKIRVNQGYYHEKEGERGLAHFLEHCVCTSGSKKYDSKATDEITDGLGYFNARTSVGRTSFKAKFLFEDLNQWLDLSSDFLMNPSFDEIRVEGERNRVLGEIRDSKSSPYFPISMELCSRLFRGHPKGIFGKGDEEVIKSVNIERLRAFHKEGYSPSNMDLIIVGNLPENIKELVDQYFGEYKRGANMRVDHFPELSPLEKQTIIQKYDYGLHNKEDPKSSSASIGLYLTVAPETHPDSFALEGISHILNLRFYESLGLEEGSYKCGASYDGDYNAGLFMINANVLVVRLEQTLDIIFEEIRRLQETEISGKKARIAKKVAKFQLAELFDSKKGNMRAIEEQLDNNRTAEGLMQGYDNLTPDSIRKTAIKYLPEDRETGRYVLIIGNPLLEE